MQKKEGKVYIRVSDNGKGFDTGKLQTNSGNGWYNINSRISLMNGKINIHSAPNEGTKIDIEIPV